MSHINDRFRTLDLRSAYAIFGISALALISEFVITFCMTFQPGWANGWPGVSKHTVLAAFIASMSWAMLLTAGTGIFAIVSGHFEKLIRRDFIGYSTFAVTMLIWTVCATAICSHLFISLR